MPSSREKLGLGTASQNLGLLAPSREKVEGKRGKEKGKRERVKGKRERVKDLIYLPFPHSSPCRIDSLLSFPFTLLREKECMVIE
jgi:hypothetical protein